MRSAFAILFSLLLVLGQTLGAMPVTAQKAAGACKACKCSMPKCCLADAPARVPTAPLGPVQSTRGQNQQLMAALAVTAVLLATPVKADDQFRAVPADLSRTPAVPLYCQNCSYLI